MLKKILFAVMFFCTVLSFAAGAEIVPEKPTLTYDKYDIDDDGVFDDMVYEISTKEELYWFANKVNGGQRHINAVLINDISVNDGLLTDILDVSMNIDEVGKTVSLSAEIKEGKTVNEWIPISGLSGMFDGLGHTVSGIYINDASKSLVGFFGSGVKSIKNLSVSDSFIIGNDRIGGVAGSAGGVYNCTFDGYIYAPQGYVGGICGSTNDAEHCINYGKVISGYMMVGGICAMANEADGSSVRYCANYGEIYGMSSDTAGVVGYSYIPVSYCYNLGSVINVKGYSAGVAGIRYTASMNNCYNAGVTKGIGNSGAVLGISGDFSDTVVKNCYFSDDGKRYDNNATRVTDEYMKTEEFFDIISAGAEGHFTKKDENSYPELASIAISIATTDDFSTDTTSHIYSVSGKTITVAADDAGVTFTVIFSDYEGNKQNAVDIVSFESKNAATKYELTTDLSLSSGDKVIVLVSTASLCPACKEYVIE